MDTIEDAAEMALDRYDERQAKKKKKPGVHRYATARGLDGFEIEGGLAREAMLRYAGGQNPDDEPEDELGDLIERRRPEGGYNPADYA